MERIAFALLFLGTYFNGVIMADHEGQTYTGKCRSTTIGDSNTPVQEGDSNTPVD